MYSFRNLISALILVVLYTAFTTDSMAQTSETGAPTLTAVHLVGSDILLTWTQDYAIPERGFEIFIDGIDTGGKYRTSATSTSISGLDLTQPHCFSIEANYKRSSYLSNQLCSDAQSQPPTVQFGPPTLDSVNLVGNDFILSWRQENTEADGGYDIYIDGLDTGGKYRTYGSSVTIGGLDPALSHCFMVKARYKASQTLYLSNEICYGNQAVNQAPTISGSPATSISEGESYLFTPSAIDPEGDTLSFSINNKPAWASFDSNSGSLSGTPATGTAGLYTGITISVSDGELGSSLASFDIQVNEAPTPQTNGAPNLTSAEIVINHIVLSWEMAFSTPIGGYDIFIDGVDTGTQYRTTSNTVSLSGLDLSIAHCFTVESRYTDSSEFYPSNQLCTNAVNQPPVITGTPSSTATVGTIYSFTPNVSDADSDNHSFTVTNLPLWAGFDSLTGTLTGTPQATDIGSNDNILITVTDGTDSSQLPAFSITVEDAIALTSTNLRWMAPSSREDGTSLPLSEIEGYRIYMGDAENSLIAIMDINDYTVTDFTLTDIPQGDHYFAVTAYDTAGNESGLSNIILRSCN